MYTGLYVLNVFSCLSFINIRNSTDSANNYLTVIAYENKHKIFDK